MKHRIRGRFDCSTFAPTNVCLGALLMLSLHVPGDDDDASDPNQHRRELRLHPAGSWGSPGARPARNSLCSGRLRPGTRVRRQPSNRGESYGERGPGAPGGSCRCLGCVRATAGTRGRNADQVAPWIRSVAPLRSRIRSSSFVHRAGFPSGRIQCISPTSDAGLGPRQSDSGPEPMAEWTSNHLAGQRRRRAATGGVSLSDSPAPRGRGPRRDRISAAAPMALHKATPEAPPL